ncbi:tetratricopeptide repeat protein [Spongiimicrobium sp. 2-473A-2-J]|uniref:tetratricopeptide repeat protein n=1 Tax=Eudoraea algarum TaxID=3417568 RepID=UPI003D36CD43
MLNFLIFIWALAGAILFYFYREMAAKGVTFKSKFLEKIFKNNRSRLSVFLLTWISIGIFLVFVNTQISANKNEAQDTQIKENREEDKKQNKKIDFTITLLIGNLIRSNSGFNISQIKDLLHNSLGYTTEEADNIINDLLNSGVYIDKAIGLYAQGMYQKSIELFNKQIENSDNKFIIALSNSYLGNIYLNKINGAEDKDPGINLLRAEQIYNTITNPKEEELASLASNYSDLGVYYKRIGNYQQSEVYYNKAITTFENLSENSKQLYYMNLGMAYNDLYILKNQTTPETTSLELLDKAIEFKKKALDSYPAVGYLQLLINSIDIKGNYYVDRKNFDQAKLNYEEALKKIKIIEDINPSNTQINPLKAKVLIDYANCFQTQYYHTRESRWLDYALDKLKMAEPLLNEELPKNNSNLLTLSSFYYAMGVVYLNKKDISNSSFYLIKSAEVRKELVDSFPENVDFISQLGHSYYELARLYFSIDKNCPRAKYYAELAVERYNSTMKFHQHNQKWLRNCEKIIKACPDM